MRKRACTVMCGGDQRWSSLPRPLSFSQRRKRSFGAEDANGFSAARDLDIDSFATGLDQEQ